MFTRFSRKGPTRPVVRRLGDGLLGIPLPEPSVRPGAFYGPSWKSGILHAYFTARQSCQGLVSD